LAHHSGQSPQTIKKDLERDFYLGPEDAIKYGIVDKIVTRHDQGVKIKENIGG
jgi:ATP-dependent Clp protease protease subunit